MENRWDEEWGQNPITATVHTTPLEFNLFWNKKVFEWLGSVSTIPIKHMLFWKQENLLNVDTLNKIWWMSADGFGAWRFNFPTV